MKKASRLGGCSPGNGLALLGPDPPNCHLPLNEELNQYDDENGDRDKV